MIVIAVMGAGLAAYGELASRAAQHEKETELLFRGNQYRQAIESYFKAQRTFPKALADLVEDRRFPAPVRHLRRLYPDPMTGEPEWALIEAPGGGIMGVHSKSESAPLRTGNFSRADAGFADAPSYTKWEFLYAPPSGPGGPTAVR